MKFHIISLSWLMLTLCLLTWTGTTAAQNADSPLPASSGENVESGASNLPDLISMATELENRSMVLENEISALPDISVAQKNLAQMAKKTKTLSRNLKILKNTKGYNYDPLFDFKAQINQETAALQELIQATNEAINQVGLWENEWVAESDRWERLQSSLSNQVSSNVLEPTFARVRQVISRSQNKITQEMAPLLTQLQAAEIIRASQSTLEIEADMLVSVLSDNLMDKSAHSMFSSKYYSRLKNGLYKELPISLRSISRPGLQFFHQQKDLILIQIFLSLILSIGIFQQRHRLMKRTQWQFIARRPLEAGIFIAAITISLFYSAVPGTWRLLSQCIVIISLARLVDAFVENVHRRKIWLVYGLSAYLITTRLFGVFDLPLSVFRLYIFFTALIGAFTCLWRSRASTRIGETRLYTLVLRLGAMLFILIVIAEITGYSALSAHLLESSLKTILIMLAGWMLMVMLRGFLEWIVYSPSLKKIPFLKTKTRIIISRSALLTNLFAATLTTTLVLVAWRVYSYPVEAIQAVWSFGVTVGPRRITVGLILMASAFLYCAFFISWAIQTMLMEGLFTKRQLPAGVRISMARLIHYGFVFLGFLMALLTLGIQLREITIIAGALGVGIGFGLQGIINDFVSGLILLFERPVKVGDYIELDGQQAEIKKIGLRATVVQTPERSEIVVPNSDLISNQVTNWTLTDQYVGIKIPVDVAYDTDIPRVMQALLECAQEHVRVADNPAPQALFMGFGKSSIDVELRGWISEVDDMDQIKSDLYQEINRKFHSSGIRIPFPQHDLHIQMVGKLTSAA